MFEFLECLLLRARYDVFKQAHLELQLDRTTQPLEYEQPDQHTEQISPGPVYAKA